MILINLLPWRDIERAERQREFLIIFGVSLLVAALLLLPVYLFIEGWISHQKGRNQYLTDQLSIMQDRIKQIKELKEKREELIARMMMIQRLETDRSVTVREFDELVKLLPSDVYYTSIKKQGGHYVIDGIAESNASISKYMRNVEQSKLVEKPTIKEVNNIGDNTKASNSFELNMSTPNADDANPLIGIKKSGPDKNASANKKSATGKPTAVAKKAPATTAKKGK